MVTRGNQEGIKVKINIMFLIGKFMKNFSYKFEEVLEMNWFLFNDLLDSLRGVRIEREMQELEMFLNEIIVENSKTKKDTFDELLDKKKQSFRNYTEFDTSERDIEEMEKTILGRSKRRNKNER